MAQTGWYRGTVCSIKDKFGFIRVSGSLPEGFNQGKDVHFVMENVYGPAVSKGTQVEFILHTKNKAKPCASLVCHIGNKPQNSDSSIPRQPRGQSIERPSVVQNHRGQSVDRTLPRENLDAGPPRKRPRGYSSERPMRQAFGHHSMDHKKVQQNFRDFYLGQICTIANNSGFLKALEDLPDNYPKDKDVQFQVNKVHSAGLKLQAGDKLQFTLGTQDTSNPKAFSLKLVEAKHRSRDDIQEYLTDAKIQLDSEQDSHRLSIHENDDPEEAADSKQYLTDLLTCPSVWEVVGSCLDMDTSTVKVFLKLLLAIKEKTKGLKQNFHSMLLTITHTPIMSPTSGSFKTFVERAVRFRIQSDIELSQNILHLFFQHIPEKANIFIPLIKLMVQGEKGSTEHFLFHALKSVTKCLVTDIEDLEWDDLPLVPSVHELTGGKFESTLHLRPVKTNGPYESSHEYMDTYFRLLRTDSFHSLQNGIKSYLAGKLDPRDMNMYHTIRLVGLEVTQAEDGFSLQIQMRPFRKIKDWSRCMNLMFGNLLCISPSGNFKDPVWATVVTRDVEMLQKKSTITISLCSECNAMSNTDAVILLMKLGKSATMAESPTYYRAYQPVLKALQSMNPEDLPFQEELVECTPRKQCRVPSYIHEQSLVEDTTPIFGESGRSQGMGDFLQNVNTKKTCLDPYQAQAVFHGLMSRLSIIQGPPGTGKTYIGIKLIQTILAISTKPVGPILALTYKNHALDEFLKPLVAEYPDEIVRVGGRSKDTDLAKVNLHEVLRGTQRDKNLLDRIRDKYAEADFVRSKLVSAAHEMKHSQRFTSQIFLDHVSQRQIEYLLETCNWKDAGFTVVHNGRKTIPTSQMIQKLLQDQRDGLIPLLKLPHSSKESPPVLKSLFRVAYQKWLPDKKTLSSVEEKFSKGSVILRDIPSAKESKDPIDDSILDEEDVAETEQERLASSSSNRSQKGELVVFSVEDNDSEPYLFSAAEMILEQNLFTPSMISENLWQLSNEERVLYIQWLLLKHMENPKDEFERLAREYQQICQEKKELEDQHKVSVIASKKVVGMTMTGASIHQELLSRVQPSVIVIEEAAEVLEPQILAVLGKWVQHLILIGDHKQLRPPVESYSLRTDYKFEISMMERMINNKMEHKTLGLQNRMRSEFAELLLDIYPKLKSNIARISKNMQATCIDQSMYFWDHHDPETGWKSMDVPAKGIVDRTQQAPRSYTNEKEADRVVRLALFLVQQGYQPKQITILGAYQGQVAMLRKKLKQSETNYPELFQTETDPSDHSEERGKIQVHTIDMYQGDENDFVIVSLVRSYEGQLRGFLNLLNRRCVAQSRAKCGLYFVGNAELLSTNPHWKGMITGMNSKGCVGSKILLRCPKHQESKCEAETGMDITLGTFCHETCNMLNSCGKHHCSLKCQPPHSHTYCAVKVLYSFPDCDHRTIKECSKDAKSMKCVESCNEIMNCKKHLCHKKCSPKHSHSYCVEIVEFNFPACGHRGEKLCSEDTCTQTCKEEVSFLHAGCGHVGKKKCYQKVSDVSCKEKCTKLLSCNHPCTMKCGEPCQGSKCMVCERIQKAEEERRRKAEELARKRTIEEAKMEIEEIKKKGPEGVFFLKELHPDDDTAVDYFMVEDMVKKYVQPTHKWFPHVKKVEKVINDDLRLKWLTVKQRLFDPNHSALKFHGTSEEAANNIIKEGFRIPQKSGMFGRGIYFATDSSKSAQDIYTKGSNILLLCDVLLGRCKTVVRAAQNTTHMDLLATGYDSLFAKRDTKDTRGVLYDEFVVYNPDQALPSYIIHFDKVIAESSLRLSDLRASLGMQGTLKVDNIKPRRQVNLEDPLDIHFRLAESQFLRLMARSGNNYQITSVDLYTNPVLMRKFSTRKIQMAAKYCNQPEAEPILAFHGTNPANIPSIMQKNFDISLLAKNTGNKGAYGAGIYFSEFPSVSIGYGGNGSLILCEVLPGKSYDCQTTMLGANLMHGYDSHRARKDTEGRGHELVIFDADQILPRYVINFQ